MFIQCYCMNDDVQELKLQDDQYVKYLKKQAEEVDLILERMEEQSRTLFKAHCQEMKQIESSFATEREALRDSQKSVILYIYTMYLSMYTCLFVEWWRQYWRGMVWDRSQLGWRGGVWGSRRRFVSH